MSKSKMMKVQQDALSGKRIALYCRVSTDRQAEEGYSLDIQHDKLHAYVKTQDNVASVTDYKDDGYSGASLERPALQRLIHDVDNGKITHVVVVKLDRLSRSQKDTLYLIEDVFGTHNVAFISMQESFSTDTPSGRAMLGIMSVFAQFERENIYERTRAGRIARVQSKKWPGGGGVPYCYDYDAEDGKLVPNAKASILRSAADRFLAGESTYQISEELGVAEKTIYNMLTSLTNCGYIVYNDVEYPDCHEAIITRETHDEIMAEMARRRAARPTGKSEHLLTGLVRCGRCGAKMRYISWGKQKSKLYCYSHQTSKMSLVKDPECDNPNPDAAEVEAAVIQKLFAIAKRNMDGAKKLVEGGQAEELLQGQLRQSKTKLGRLYDLYGDQGDEQLLETIQTVKAEIARLEVQINDEKLREKHRRDAMMTLQRIDTLEDAWPAMTIAERRTVLGSVIERITITGEQIDVKLRYSLSG